MAPIKVGVLVDWERSARANAWMELLQKQHARIPTEVTNYRIADLIVAPGSAANEATLNSINAEQVLVVNWDAANGDPEFGAHLMLNWLRHRSPEILMWVREGNVLIIESQTVFGSPCQDAYDAAVGPGELPMSRVPESSKPLTFLDQIGSCCRKTKYFPKSRGFDNVENVLRASNALSFEVMFPKSATKLLSSQIADLDWTRMLYRGWFRRSMPFFKALPWVSILKTGDRLAIFQQSTLKVARLGTGAIFASTMMISTSGQGRLATAMVECAGGNTDHLPATKSFVDLARKYWKVMISVFSGVAASILLKPGEQTIRHVYHLKGISSQFGEGVLTSAITLLLAALGVAAFYVLLWTIKWVRRLLINVIGL